MWCGGAAERDGPGLRAFRNRQSQRADKSAQRTNENSPALQCWDQRRIKTRSP